MKWRETLNWQNKSILVTGGTGSFARNFIRFLLEHHQPKVIRVYSRDEHKQTEFLGQYGGIKGGKENFPVRGFIGDIRDARRLNMAMEGIDVVVHAAALKQVQSCEYNPIETIKTNIYGAQNIVEAALANNVESVLGISTDKAVSPLNLYGATKMCMEHIFRQANAYRGSKRTKFACTRYGNVADSRGTVVHIWRKNLIDGKPIKITNSKATRYWIKMYEANRFIMESIELMEEFDGGEIFIPVIPSIRIMDLKSAMAPDSEYEIIGDRVGDKLHEDMILKEEITHTVQYQNKYVILPEDPSWKYVLPKECKKLYGYEQGMTSGNNEWFLSPEEIRLGLEESARLSLLPS